MRLSKSVTPTEAGELEWYYSMWPSAALSEPWLAMARRLYTETHVLPVLYSTVAQGKWVKPSEAIYVGGGSEDAVHVRKALLCDGKEVIELPDTVLQCFENVKLPLFNAGPKWVRAHLKTAPTTAVWRRMGAGMRETHLALLRFCLSDFVLGAPPDSTGGVMYAELCGLPIVPTADGKSSQTFGKPSVSVAESLLVATAQESELLARLQAQIVDPVLPSCVLEHLTSDAMAAYTNVKVVTPEVVAACLQRVLPDGWKGVEEVQWRVGNDRQPDAAWMRLFWEVSLSNCLIKSMS